jgi:hypothetical protein
LPLFFVFTGLRTEIGLLNDPYLWKITGFIIMVAVLGKFIGSAIAAKFVGQTWKDSLTIGALMNTRGLMELVVLNIGYDLGVLTPEVFAMMVIMALVTTFMTGPLLDFINWAFKAQQKELAQDFASTNKFKILVSFGNPNRGRVLLRISNGFINKFKSNAAVTVMHLSPVNELHQYNVKEYEKESFLPIIEESENLNQKITTLYKASNDLDYEIAEVANNGDYDLLLIGIGQSMFDGSLLGRILGFTTRIINPEKLINQVTGKESLYDNYPFDERTKQILNRCKIATGVLVDKGYTKLEHVLVSISQKEDIFLLGFAQKLIKNSDAQIVILDLKEVIKKNITLKEEIRSIEQSAPNHITVLNDKQIDREFLKRQDLMLIGIESWKNLVDDNSRWLSNIPSTLILKEASNL